MPITIREYLGDEKITQLENMGFLPNLIADMAKRQYMSDKQAKRNELADSGLDGKLVQGIMREEISEEEARNAQKFEDFGAKKHGWGLGAAKAVAGIANAAERVSDFINPFYEGKRDEKGDYVYQNAIEKGLRPKIKSAEKLRDDYEKATGETSWGSRAAEIGTEMVADPLNFFSGIGLLSKGSKLAQFGKKSLYFAGTGAASGGVMALGEGKNDEETLKNMGYGAAGGFVLGHAIDQSVQGISKLIAKRRASRVANEADAVSQAENSEFLRATDDLGGSEIKAADGNSDAARRGADEAVNTESSARGGEASDGAIKQSSSSQREVDVQTMTAREFATSEAGLDEETAAKVVKEAAQGKEKSDFVDADTYADVVKFKNFENQRDYARAYGEQIEAAKQSLESAREQSAVRYAQTQKAINEYQKQGMSVSATRELINAKFKPGADEINYTRAFNDGADVDPRLAGQGIFYALEKDIAAQAYTPEIYAARLKQRGFSDESAQAFTQAYVKKDINIAKDYANAKAAEVYDEQIRKNLTREFEINAKNGVNINKDEAYRQHPMIRPDGPSIEQGGLKRDKLTVAREKLASEINVDKLNDEQKDVYDVFVGNKDKVTLQGKDLNDLYMLERGSRNAGVKKIMIKHAGIEKTGGLTNEELLGIMDVVRGGRIAEDSFEQFSDRIRYAYDLKENGVKFRVVIDEYNDGKKVFDYYSDRNFVDYQQDRRGLARTFDPHSRVQVPSATDEIIPQKGNLVNEKEANGLRDSVSGIGDNASRAGGRQASDEQILRQGRRDTANASQTKRPAQSDEQVEQPGAAKADGEVDAAASGEQVVEKQGSGASIGGGVAANSNAHLGSGLVTGTLNSVDEEGNFSPERFAAGFLAGLVGGKAAAVGLRKMTPKLYNQILGIAEKMPQMANGNPRLLGKLYSNGKDVSLNSFAGEKAITANVGKLDQAKAMLEKGMDEVEIWQKTGWFKDEIDDKWKFEINPRGGELKPNPPRNTVLYNVLNDEKLYEAYPELQLYKVELAGEYNPAALKALGSADGEFIPSQKTFIINEKTTDFKSTLYHEIQHAIQEIEGFSPGASSKNGKYWLAGGEVEARNVQKRMNDVSYDGFKNSTSMEFFPYKEEAQLQRMAGDKEYMEYHELSKKFDDYLNDKGDELSAQEEARLSELYEKIKDRLGFTGDDYKKGYELYLKENAEYQKHPLHTLDAPRGERVNIGRGDLNLSKELEKKYILKDGSINEAAVGKEAEPFIEKEYSLENFKAEFSNGKVDTPIGEVDISSSQFQKLERKGRKKYLGLIKPTLERPVFVVDFEDTTFFFKPFRDKDGIVKFASVIKERDGGLDVISNYPMKNRKFELITREGKVRYVRSSGGLKPIEHSSDGKGIIQQNEEKVHHYRKIEEIKREHPNVEKELDESIAAMNKESFNDSNFKDGLISKFDTKEITTQELGKSVNLSDKQLAVLKNDIKNADFKVINESKIYFDKIGKDGDKKRFFVDIAEDGSLRVDGYSKKDIDSIPVKQSALEELAGTGDAARLKNMSFEVKAAYRNELDPIKKEAILKTAELNKLKKAAQSGDKAAAAKFEEFKARNLDENGNIKDGLSLC